MKIGITGSQGMLGGALLSSFGADNCVAWNRQNLDITNPEQVEEELKKNPVDVLIHCAALTNVNFCQVNPDEAHKINVVGTQHLVESLPSHAFFVYISSTGNYGSWKKESYTEEDHCEPPTVYHQSKWDGEKLVAEQREHYLIVRTGWLYGGDKEHKKNFVYQRYLDAVDKSQIYGDDSQVGNPTFVGNVANQLKVLLERKIAGIINCVDIGSASRLEYVQEIINCFGLNCKVEVAPPGYFARSAPVSPNESAVNEKLSELGINQMEDWKDALSQYIQSLKD